MQDVSPTPSLPFGLFRKPGWTLHHLLHPKWIGKCFTVSFSGQKISSIVTCRVVVPHCSWKCLSELLDMMRDELLQFLLTVNPVEHNLAV